MGPLLTQIRTAYCLPRPRSVAIYNQTTIINNVVIGNNNTVINRGISTDRVREHTRAEVRTVSLREENVQAAACMAGSLERDGAPWWCGPQFRRMFAARAARPKPCWQILNPPRPTVAGIWQSARASGKTAPAAGQTKIAITVAAQPDSHCARHRNRDQDSDEFSLHRCASSSTTRVLAAGTSVAQ